MFRNKKNIAIFLVIFIFALAMLLVFILLQKIHVNPIPPLNT